MVWYDSIVGFVKFVVMILVMYLAYMIANKKSVWNHWDKLNKRYDDVFRRKDKPSKGTKAGHMAK